ncbi:MAG: GTP-binding protein [Kangiellaceae bacterium]|nr:GTP-binding protein [Kangiellaceae bacterium]
MRELIKMLALAVLVAGASTTLSAASSYKKLTTAWEAIGFKMPESVVYDAKRDQYYVSNVNMSPMAQDNNGSIGLIRNHGKDVTVEWISGLSSPKGMDLQGNKLFVADVKELVVIDVEKSKIIARYPAPESGLLNGLAIGNGEIFVSDWMGNAIYKLGTHGLEIWLSSKELDFPNGLYVKDEYLYIGSWGRNPKPDFTTETTGGLKRISLKNKKITSITSGSDWMNVDGLHSNGSGKWLLTDFIAGKLLLVNEAGKIEHTYTLEPSAADFFYVKEKGLVVVPYLMGQKVVAYKY